MNRERNPSNSVAKIDRQPSTVTTKIALAAAALNIASMAWHGVQGYDMAEAQKPTVEASQEAQNVNPRDLLKDTHVIKIERTNSDGVEPRYTDGAIRSAIRSAGEVLEGLSKDELTLPEVADINTIKLTPEGLYTNDQNKQSVECYSDEQLDRAQSLYLENSKLPAATSLMTVINQGDSCTMLSVGAAAMVDNVNGMRIGTMYGSALTENVVLHEVGHILGLGHAASLYCNDPTTKTVLERGKTDIGKLVEYGCVIPKQDGSDKPNMYSDRMTVMGGILSESVDQFTEHFNSTETTILAPDIAKNKDVLPERATYELSTYYEELRAISFALPADHPLRRIDPKIDTLSVGLASAAFNDKPNATIQVIAHYDDQSYRLGHVLPYISGYDSSLGSVEIYHDETLGVKVIIGPGKNNSSVKVTVEPIK
jgi:hypothetical protein